MQTTVFIRSLLESSKAWALRLIQDMEDSPLTQPTPHGGNHPLWILGHIVCSESDLLDVFILGKPNRFPEWGGLFSMGSTPSTDASQYPSMEELLATFEAMRGATLSYLDTLSDADLDRPSNAPEQFQPFFGTIGACFGAMCSHVSFHTGQVSVARRAAGRTPLMA
jgi:hypothetical protein